MPQTGENDVESFCSTHCFSLDCFVPRNDVISNSLILASLGVLYLQNFRMTICVAVIARNEAIQKSQTIKALQNLSLVACEEIRSAMGEHTGSPLQIMPFQDPMREIAVSDNFYRA